MKGRDGSMPNDEWATPKWLYDKLNAEFKFTFDPCPLKKKKKGFNGLKIEWGKRNFVNPPYNKIDKPAFIRKAYEQYKKGKLSVMLLPIATSTAIFHDLIVPNCEIRFIRGRVNFAGYNTFGKYVTNIKGKHDSMIVIFDPNKKPKPVKTY